jgi:monoamine oxidase
MSDYEVIVVGAGAAGIGAGRRLREAGCRFLVLEARDRVGGRAYSDSSFPVPFDHGCSWLWGQEKNSLYRLAGDLGFTLVPDPKENVRLYHGDRPGTGAECAAYRGRQSEVFHAIDATPGDRPLSEVVALEGSYSGLLASMLGPQMLGEELERASHCEWQGLPGRGLDYFVKESLGNLVSAVAKDLPVELGCPVAHVDWGADPIVVESKRGRMTADAVILTVPNGVLRREALRLTPRLPDRQQAALEALPMGLLNKVALEFDRDVFGLPANSHVHQAELSRPPLIVASYCGAPMAMCLIGGDNARNLEKEGERASIDAALEALVKTFGTSLRTAFKRGAATAWSEDPWAFGSYSVARPGGAGYRGVLGEPFDERLMLAGEAAAKDDAALVNGAFDSGTKAAERYLRGVGIPGNR